jgi:hypothetical protein
LKEDDLSPTSHPSNVVIDEEVERAGAPLGNPSGSESGIIARSIDFAFVDGDDDLERAQRVRNRQYFNTKRQAAADRRESSLSHVPP